MAVQPQHNYLRPRNQSELDSILKDHQQLAFLDFYKEGCEKCSKISPVFEQLAEKFHCDYSAAFIQINVDRFKDLTKQYGVTLEPMMPLFVALVDGKEADRYEGTDFKQLKEFIESFAQHRRGAGDQGSSMPQQQQQQQQKQEQQQQQQSPLKQEEAKQQSPKMDLNLENSGVISIHVLDKDGKKHELSLPEGMTLSHLTDKFHGRGIQIGKEGEGKTIQGADLAKLTFSSAEICDGACLRIV